MGLTERTPRPEPRKPLSSNSQTALTERTQRPEPNAPPPLLKTALTERMPRPEPHALLPLPVTALTERPLTEKHAPDSLKEHEVISEASRSEKGINVHVKLLNEAKSCGI